MKLSTPINASHWPSFSNEGLIFYSAQENPPTTVEACRKDYRAFAWISFNPLTQEIMAARDHFGLEPFYYCLQDQRFIFGSSIPDILKHLERTPPLNEEAVLDECFSKGVIDFPAYRTETFYKGIYRLRPGCILRIQDGQIREEAFWQLDLKAAEIQYADEREYLAHFPSLLHEAVQFNTQGKTALAAELSGGMDSTSVLLACQQLGVKPALFTHQNPEAGTQEEEHTQRLIKQFDLAHLHQYIDAEEFDPISVFQSCAALFAGAPPHLFYILAHNIHEAVAQGGYTTLLSGFGGDQCVSGHVAPRAYYPQLLREQGWQQAWQELKSQYQLKGELPSHSALKRFLELTRYAHPWSYALLGELGDVKSRLKTYLQGKIPEPKKPRRARYRTAREYEYDLLQGQVSQEVYLRVEYSAVVAKSWGFEYAYPMLYPPLVEFCFRLPLLQKRRDGGGRYLIRQYLAKHLKEPMPQSLKMTGAILPATMKKCEDYLAQGKFDSDFKDLPFSAQIQKTQNPRYQLMHQMFAYMFKHYDEINRVLAKK